MEHLPVPNQHPLPDDLPKNIRADASQHGEWAVGIVEAVQQNLRHLSLLLSPEEEKKQFWGLIELRIN